MQNFSVLVLAYNINETEEITLRSFFIAFVISQSQYIKKNYKDVTKILENWSTWNNR